MRPSLADKNKGAYIWLAPIKDFNDIDKLHTPQITVDYDKTRQLLEQAEEVFKDLLKVRLKVFGGGHLVLH